MLSDAYLLLFCRWNTVQDGILIDFSLHMNAVTYNAAAKTATVQPGARWGQVYDTLIPYGMSAVGGRLT